ncbi:PilW family protein [Candidatus Nitrospira bockiana]
MMMSLFGDDRGICLLEVMIAATAGFVVLSASLQAAEHFERRFSSQQHVMSRHQDQRLGVHVLEEELRLAGSGAPAGADAVLTAEPQAVEFLANLDGLVTRLSGPVTGLAVDLPVANAQGWRQGKRIIVCEGPRCVEQGLLTDGTRGLLRMTAPLGQSFPAGSEVYVSNRVRYYLGKGRSGRTSVMRMVDGGANTIVGEVAEFRLVYLGKDGQPTTDPARIARVGITLRVGDDRRALITEVALRGY